METASLKIANSDFGMAACVVRDVPGASAAGLVRRPGASSPEAEPRQAARPSAVARTCPCCDGSDAPAKASVEESDETNQTNMYKDRTETKLQPRRD